MFPQLSFKRLVIVSIPVLLFLFLPGTSRAAFQASDALGQFPYHATSFVTADTDNGGIINDGGMGFIYGVAIDSVHHRLFVSDEGNDRILEYNLDSNNKLQHHYADHVIGQADFTGSLPNRGGTESASGLSNNAGLAYASDTDQLFVADESNQRVLIYDLSGGITDGMAASHVLGQSGFTTSAYGTTQSSFLSPIALAYDVHTHTLAVADKGNNRVLIFDLSGGITDGMAASHVLGQLNFTVGTANQGGTVSSSSMKTPFTVYYDDTGNHLYVGDEGNYRVLVYDTTGTISDGMGASHVIGEPDFVSASWTTASSTSIGWADQIAFDSNHQRLFVSDDKSCRIMVYDVSGGVTNGMAASYILGAGTANLNGAGTCNTSQTEINDPEVGMVYDTVSNLLWLSDSSDNRVMQWDFSSGISNNQPASDLLGQIDGGGNLDWAGSYYDRKNVPNYFGYNYPDGLALDTVHHRLFVTDSGNNRVLEYDLNSSNSLLHHYADHVLGQLDFNSKSANQGGSVGPSTMSTPEGLAYDSVHDRLFVTDVNNSRILVYDLSGGVINGMSASYVLGQPDFVSNYTNQNIGHPDSMTLAGPSGLAYDPDSNRLFVTDTTINSNNRVLVFDFSSGISNGMSASYVLGQPDFISGQANQGGTLSSTTLNFPYAISYDKNHKRLFVDDDFNNRLLIFDLSAGISNDMPASYVLGQPDFTTSNSNSPSAKESSSYFAEELAYDPNNDRLFVGDDGTSRILVFDLSAGITNYMPASAVIGPTDFTTDGYSLAISTSTINDPEVGMVYDPTIDRLWMTDDSNNRVLTWDFVHISLSTLADGTIGSAYTQTLIATQTQGTPSWNIASGTLPTGLTLNSTTGAITGIPSSVGVYNFSVIATDTLSVNQVFTDQAAYTITVSSGSSTTSPTVVTDNTTSITATTSILHGSITVTGGENASESGFVYSTSSSMSVVIATTTLGGQIGTSSFSQNVSNLSCGTTYYDQAYAKNSGGTGYGSISSFTTTACSVVNNQPAISVTYSGSSVSPQQLQILLGIPPTNPTSTALVQNPVTPVTHIVPKDVTTHEVNAVIPVTQQRGPTANSQSNSSMSSSTVVSTVAEKTSSSGFHPDYHTLLAAADATEGVAVVKITGLAVGVSSMIASLFASPLSPAEWILIPLRLWGLVLVTFGLRRRFPPWGTVYDSVTKQPIDPAYVTIDDEHGNQVQEMFTDINGRYGLFLKPGRYRIKAAKTNYVFPSQKLDGVQSDELYNDLYYGEWFEVSSVGQVIEKNIPLDAVGFDWNEMAKKDTGVMSFYARHARMIVYIMNVIFIVGFAISALATVSNPTWYNIFATAVYVCIGFALVFGIRSKALGRITDKVTGKPLSYALVRVLTTNGETELSHGVTDKYGRYYCLIPERRDSYRVVIQQKNQGGSYEPVGQDIIVSGVSGVITKDFRV